jgi:DNA polymerase-3 subunit alpha
MGAEPHSGPGSFVHLDVISAFSRLASPSTPQEYVTTLLQQFPLDEHTPADEPKPAIALCDDGLQSTVKMAVACARAAVDHLCGLRLRVVPEAAWHPWAEQPRELLLLAGDEEAWLSLVALHNRAHLSGADHHGPRVDWQDLADLCRGELICLTGAPLAGVLAPYIERADDPAEPRAALARTRWLSELFPDRLYLELAYHGQPREKLINRGLVALSQLLDLPLVATNAVRYARRQDAQAAVALDAMRRGSRAEGVLAGARADPTDAPIVGLEMAAARAQAYLRTPGEMYRRFAQLPDALAATVRIRDRLRFRLPLDRDQPPAERYGPALLFGLGPAHDLDAQQLTEVVNRELTVRCADTGRGQPTPDMRARVDAELRALCGAGLAELLLTAYELGRFCRQHEIPIAARGSATSSLVAWALGLVGLCPLDYDLDRQQFVSEGRTDLPDLDLEVSSLHEPAVSAFLARHGVQRLNRGPTTGSGLPALGTLRLGVHVSLGARQAVRSVGAALGLDPIALNGLARQAPLLSSPGAIDQVLFRAPELGGGLAATYEPGQTIMRLASQLEGLPQRDGAHPSAYAVSFLGPGALSWLPAAWVRADRPDRPRFHGPRHLAVSHGSALGTTDLTHPIAVAPNDRPASTGWITSEDGIDFQDELFGVVSGAGGGPVLACAWDKADVEALGIARLDIRTSAATTPLASGWAPEHGADVVQGAWRVLAAGDTRCISQVETPGMQALLRRFRDAANASPAAALASLEDLAQLLALWRPGAFHKDHEQGYLATRFERQRQSYLHPAMAAILDPTCGALLYTDQVAQLVQLFDLSHAWADRLRRAQTTGRHDERLAMEAELKDRARRRGWNDDQVHGLLALLQAHAGYLYAHGHALALAQHVFDQTCRKLNPETVASFFADVLNNGGSVQYGLGAAVEEARRWSVMLRPPCVNQSADRYAVERAGGDDASDVGTIRVPLTAIRGLGPEAARHIVQMRTAFGPFTSLLDFVRRMDARLVSRYELQVLIRLGAFSFTGLPRAQLMLAEHVYASAGDLLRATDRDPTALGSMEAELAELVGSQAGVAEWPPEVIAADELACLGFYVVPRDVQQHARRIAEEFSTLDIVELGGQPHNALVAIAGVVTTLRIRQTRKGEQMAWLTLTDGTGAVECAIFPAAYQRLGQPTTVLREGAFLVANGKVAHEETTGSKVWLERLTPVGGAGTQLTALRTAVEHRQVLG